MIRNHTFIWPIKPADYLALGVGLVLVALAMCAGYSPNTNNPTVSVRSQKGEWLYPLESGRVLAIEGPLGSTRVIIAHNAVHIESSPCANKTCIHMGTISKPGQWLACVPNQVLVHIESHSQEVDAATW